MTVRNGKLFIISGPSGVGKGTIVRGLLDVINEVTVSKSVTTRPPRDGEQNGREYYFVNDRVFDELIYQDRLLEWARVYSNRYGTPRDFVLENLSAGQDIILEIDIQGALQVQKKMPQGVFIFITPPSIDDLVYRLHKRGQDSEENIKARLAACQSEMEHMQDYDYMVINDIIDDAIDRVRAIIIAERCKMIKKLEG